MRSLASCAHRKRLSQRVSAPGSPRAAPVASTSPGASATAAPPSAACISGRPRGRSRISVRVTTATTVARTAASERPGKTSSACSIAREDTGPAGLIARLLPTERIASSRWPSAGRANQASAMPSFRQQRQPAARSRRLRRLRVGSGCPQLRSWKPASVKRRTSSSRC